MDMKTLREQHGLSRNEICEMMNIPYRTVQDWELGNRKCPDWVMMLIKYRLEH